MTSPLPSEPAAAVLPACSDGDFDLLPNVDGAGMGLVPEIDIRFHGSRPCNLRLTLRLTIYAKGGATIPIDGNGSVLDVDRDLPSELGGAAWWWTNWCGKARSFEFVVSGPTRDVRWEADGAPVCNGGPSTLAAIP